MEPAIIVLDDAMAMMTPGALHKKWTNEVHNTRTTPHQSETYGPSPSIAFRVWVFRCGLVF
jgi:hypothetical protein